MTDPAGMPPPGHPGRLPVLREPGWIAVGDGGDGSTWARRPHRRYCLPFAVRSDGARPIPLVTWSDIGALAAAGRYGAARARADDDGLRPPETLLMQPGPPDSPAPLRFAEAELVCHLLGGRLAEETELEHLIQGHAPALPWPPEGIWTATPWSVWSYRLLAWHMDGWVAARDRRLPDADRAAPATLFQAGQPPSRRPGEPGELAGACLVLPC